MHPWPDCLHCGIILDLSRHYALVAARLAGAARARELYGPALVPGTQYPPHPARCARVWSIPMVGLRLCRFSIIPKIKVADSNIIVVSYLVYVCQLALSCRQKKTQRTPGICLPLNHWNKNVDAEHRYMRILRISYSYIRTQLDLYIPLSRCVFSSLTSALGPTYEVVLFCFFFDTCRFLL